MERIQGRHPDPEDPYIVLNFTRNDGDFTEDVLDAVVTITIPHFSLSLSLSEHVLLVACIFPSISTPCSSSFTLKL